MSETTQPSESLPEVRPVLVSDWLEQSQLGAMLRFRRGNRSLRQVAKETGVSFNTLVRVESGQQPSLTSFTRLCAWLGIWPGEFFRSIPESELAPIDDAIGRLATDPRLSLESVEKIANVVRNLYDVLALPEVAK
jgi:transcriptional regulator with XRE-family HTH domain